jgi:hypothetical protein
MIGFLVTVWANISGDQLACTGYSSRVSWFGSGYDYAVPEGTLIKDVLLRLLSV